MKNINSLALKQVEQRLKKLRLMLNETSVRGGWIRYMRQAMRMTLSNLGKLANISPSTIQQMEKRESEGKVTIETMQKIARAMECEFVYAIVPREDLQKLLKRRALSKAAQIVEEADVHMTLENQKVSEDVKVRIERIAEELFSKGDLW